MEDFVTANILNGSSIDESCFSAQDCLNLIEFLIREKKLKKEYYDQFEVEQMLKDFLRYN